MGATARCSWVRARARKPHGRGLLLAGLLALAATALLASPATAQPAPQAAPEPAPAAAPAPAPAPWAQPFAPPVGSRWRITVEVTATEMVDAIMREAKLTRRYDLAYTAREGTGYLVTLVLREVAVDGNVPALRTTATALAPFRDLAVKGITDSAGSPQRVVNEAEVRASATAAGERLMARFADKPQTVALMRRALSDALTPKDAAAAALWLEPLPLLASAQRTLLRPGAEHRAASSIASPFGGLIRSETVTRLAPYARPERFTLLSTIQPDAGSLAGAVLAAIRQTAATRPKSPDLNERATKEMLSKSALDMRVTMEIDVTRGMARRARKEVTVDANVSGQAVTGIRTTLVTVTPAP